MPARQYTKQDGSTTCTRLVDFTDRDAHARFQKLAKEAVDRCLGHEMSNEEDVVSQKRCDNSRDRVLAANRSG